MIPPNKQISAAAIWGIFQVLFLVIGASGFPLWAHHPFPREALAFSEMICGQALLFALFSASLAESGWGLLLVLILTLPMDELAGLLSNTPQIIIIKGFACISLWAAGLVGCVGVLGTSRWIPLVPALATLLTAGGAILDYLMAEAQAGTLRHEIWIPVSLLPNLCLLIEHGSSVAWVETTMPLFLFFVAHIIGRVCRYYQS
jgi:hypothetical protein